MDLFGKQARQELEQLREKMNGLDLRYSDIVARHSAISEELRESKVFITTINSSNKLKTQYEVEKRDHYQKAAEYSRKSKEIDSKEAEILAAHEKKKATLTKEMRELEGKVSVIKAELADSQKRAKTLEKEIQTAENKRDSVAAEIEKLKTGRSNAETALSKSQEKQSELVAAVDKLTRQHETLASSNLYLNQVVSRLNRHGDDDTVFASLEHDLHRFLTHDQTSGAMQVTLKASPLLLVIDLGYDALNFAAARAGLVSGGSEIALSLEFRKIEQGIGCSRFETLLAGWVWERFSAIHPRLKKSVKQQKGIEFSLPVAKRLLELPCQGAPQGEVEETIVIDSEPFSASIPLLREELVSVFLPLLGPDGELTGAIRRFFAEFKLSVDAIDRVVCMGWYGRLPLLRESLGEVFKRPVLVVEQLGTVGASINVPSKLSGENPLLKLEEVKNIARNKGVIISGGDGKRVIIHATQKIEGNAVCFAVGSSKACDQNGCCWRGDCEEFDCNDLANGGTRITIIRSGPEMAKREKEQKGRLDCFVKQVYDFKFFTDVVIDTRTNLMWALDADLAGKEMRWDEAVNWVEKLNYGGYSNWRLPTMNELYSLRDFYEGSPTDYLNSIGFVNVQTGEYWSSTTLEGLSGFRFRMHTSLYCSGGYFEFGTGYVWPVRSGEN